MNNQNKIIILENKLKITDDRREQIDLKNQLSEILFDYDLARSMDLCIEVLESSCLYPEGTIYAKINLCYAYLLSGQMDESLILIRELFPLVENNVTYQIFFIRLLTVYGYILSRISDISTSLKHLYWAADLARQINNHVLESRAYSSIASVYSEMGKTEKALVFFEKASGLNRENEDWLAFVNNNLACIYMDINQLDKALEYAKKSYRAASEHNIYRLFPHVLDTLGDILRQQKKYGEAVSYLNKALTLSRRSGNRLAEVGALLNLGNVYAELVDEKALKCLHEALDLAETLDTRLEIALCHKVLADFFEKTGDSDKALKHFRIYHETDKEVFIRNTDKRVEALVVMNETERLRQSLREKETQIKEIHHRVKNNLNMVSSLIKLKTIQYENKEITNALVNQIHAIGLVHDKLYHSEQLKEVHFRGYAEDLLETVFTSVSEYNVEISYDMDDVMLSDKTVTTLGLIINEAALNAVKHGYKPGRPCSFSLILRKAEGYSLIISNSSHNESMAADSRISDDSMGLQLIQALVHQLGGSLTITTGTSYSLNITFQQTGQNPS